MISSSFHYWNLILLLLAPYCVTVPQCSRKTQTLGVSLALGLCVSDISTGEELVVGKHRRKVRNGAQETIHQHLTGDSLSEPDPNLTTIFCRIHPTHYSFHIVHLEVRDTTVCCSVLLQYRGCEDVPGGDCQKCIVMSTTAM